MIQQKKQIDCYRCGIDLGEFDEEIAHYVWLCGKCSILYDKGEWSVFEGWAK